VRRWGRVLLLALVFSAGASTASADFAPVGERDAMGNPVVAAAVTWGSGWLAAHNVHECATTTGSIHMADDLGTYVDEQGKLQKYGGATIGCNVWILTELVADANSRGRWPVATLAAVLVHELAHTGGVSHKVMAAGLEALWTQDCRIFGERVERYARIQRAQARAGRRR
jgi:hypothetical protein